MQAVVSLCQPTSQKSPTLLVVCLYFAVPRLTGQKSQVNSCLVNLPANAKNKRDLVELGFAKGPAQSQPYAQQRIAWIVDHDTLQNPNAGVIPLDMSAL